MNKWNLLFCSFAVAGVAGCGGDPASVRPAIQSVAYAEKLADGTYEVQLGYSTTTSGGPCLSKDWFKVRTVFSTNWIYLKRLDGVMTADKMVVTDEAGKREWPYAHTNMQGIVSITNATMMVRLEQPDVDSHGNEKSTYVPYFLNGSYEIRERSP